MRLVTPPVVRRSADKGSWRARARQAHSLGPTDIIRNATLGVRSAVVTFPLGPKIRGRWVTRCTFPFDALVSERVGEGGTII